MSGVVDPFVGGGQGALAGAMNALDSVSGPPFETAELRRLLTAFLNTRIPSGPNAGQVVGNFKWGIYAFFDYDGEPIYVGQTNEKLRTRIRRHLTNQRTDAVAMSVLDPFEVFKIRVWPLPQFEDISGTVAIVQAKAYLNALEKKITDGLVNASEFNAILNEKDPPTSSVDATIPQHYDGVIVSDSVRVLRSHPDFRIARRALIISRLAQVIAERQVQGGLRRVLLTQAKRLQWLAQRRYDSTGGAASVEQEGQAEEAD